jgi:L-threonylcarbamoyladenylate synthase
VALDLLKQTGPMAVSSANLTGSPPATTAGEAVVQLGDSVSVYLDGGPCPGGVPSTIVDLTGSVPRLMRAGAISLDRLREVAALVTGAEPATAASAGTPKGGPAPGTADSGTADSGPPAESAQGAEGADGAGSGAAAGPEPGETGAEAASGAAEKETGPTA